MAVTVGGTSITFNDGTTQSTAAGAVTTTQVLNATASAAYGAVGTYTYAYSSPPALNPGATIAGSGLRFLDSSGVAYNPGLSGTWRNMGGSNSGYPMLFLRIS